MKPVSGVKSNVSVRVLVMATFEKSRALALDWSTTSQKAVEVTEKKVLCVADIRARLPETIRYKTLQGSSEEEKAKDFALTGNVTLSYLVLEQAIADLKLAGPRLGAAALAE